MLAAHAAEAACAERRGETIHRLTIDARLQASLEATGARARSSGSARSFPSPSWSIDNATGEVRAQVGSAD